MRTQNTWKAEKLIMGSWGSRDMWKIDNKYNQD